MDPSEIKKLGLQMSYYDCFYIPENEYCASNKVQSQYGREICEKVYIYCKYFL